MDSVLQAGVISAPLQVILDKLAAFTLHETSLILGVDEELRKLHRSLERVRAMVGHVQERPSIFSNTISNEAWKLWLEDVDVLSYSADDLLDSVLLDLSKCSPNEENKVRDMIFSSFQLTVPRDITRIRRDLEEIVKEMESLYMTELTKLGSDKCRGSCSSYYSCPTSSMVDGGSVVGRYRERDDLVRLLLNRDLDVFVVPVVGMAGIGKTTLAQLVYNDEVIDSRFTLKMWVSVSTNFNVIGITKAIIESASGQRCELSNLDPVQVKLRNLIRGERFLLVLDDYWSEEYRDWDVLSSPFKFGAKGSKIILTTRSMIVSQIVSTDGSYDLECLSDENCWEIVRQRASSSTTLETQLEEIGRMIARKCKGLPLAAKTLGSMLHFKDDPAEWISVLESEIWDLSLEKNDILPALAISYYHLPAQLKRCFTYCSMFPKNHDFEMNELVLLWMAEGFIRPAGKMRLEDIAADCFKSLVWRSFFQQSRVNTEGQDIYKMHDLIHSMAQLISGHSCLSQEDNHENQGYKVFRNTRHVSLNCATMQPVLLKGCFWYKNLRTFRVISDGNVEVSYDLFLKLKFLRVLDLSRTGLLELPDSIGCLKHLRYLNLSENGFIKLPESLTNLLGLQILKLKQCFNLLELPTLMKNMVSLRHLLLDTKHLTSLPPEFGKLVNLQSLSVFIVGRNEGYGIGELKNMSFLRGCICIKSLENVANVNEAKEAMLHSKPFLDRLELEWNDMGARSNDEEILAGLQPHENLKELVMTNYKGYLLPSWFSSSLCKLSNISLQKCKYHYVLTVLGTLQHLKSLVIEGMSSWFVVDGEFSGFPSLNTLAIKDMSNLRSWEPFNGSRFPHLSILEIDDCPMLTNLPSLLDTGSLHRLSINRCPEIESLPDDGLPLSLEAFVISDCDIIKERCRVEEGADWYKIRSIPRIQIDYMEIDQDMRRF